MGKLNKYLFYAFAFVTMIGIESCKDYDDKDNPHADDISLTREMLDDIWTMDLDGSSEHNYMTLQLDFSSNESNLQLTAIDFGNADLLEMTTPIPSWDVKDNFLSTPNQYGHREVLAISMGDSITHLQVKTVTKDAVDLFFPYTLGNGTVIEVPFNLVRRDAVGNKAQLIKMSKEETKLFVQEVHNQNVYKVEAPNKWMEKIDGRRRVCDMVIPGTHDSTTDNCNLVLQFAGQTQVHSVGTQWDMGGRVFDLRVRNYEGDVEMCHGPVPCNYTFRETFSTILDRVIRDDTEFATLFINTESQPMGFMEGLENAMGDKAFSVISAFFTMGIAEIHANPLDEELTRKLVYEVITDELKKKNAEKRICYYRPDLTLDEARGKIIIINRVPKDFKRGQWSFVGQSLIKDKWHIIADDPQKCPDIYDGYAENKEYFADEDDYESNEEFDRKRKEEYGDYARMGYNQVDYGTTNLIIDNCTTSSYPSSVYGITFEWPDYVDATNVQYPWFIDINKSQRSCGFRRQDFLGADKYVYISPTEMVTEALILLPTLLVPQAAAMALWTYMKARKELVNTDGIDVYGKQLLESSINMNFVDVPLREASIDKTYSEVKKGDVLRLKVKDFIPRDANIGINVVSWESDNSSVAQSAGDGVFNIVGYGNAVVTATMESGYKAIAYICCASSSIKSVDLGLSVKWGNRNLGAAAPEYMGIPFAWGETEPRTVFAESRYKWFSDGDYSAYSQKDPRRKLSLEDDAAHVMLGGKWRMPTIAEVEELLAPPTTITSTTLNGRNVLELKRNGHTIYLPEAPYRNDIAWSDQDTPEGYFWTSSIYENKNTMEALWPQAYCLYTELDMSHLVSPLNFKRFYGLAIRPVQEK